MHYSLKVNNRVTSYKRIQPKLGFILRYEQRLSALSSASTLYLMIIGGL